MPSQFGGLLGERTKSEGSSSSEDAESIDPVNTPTARAKPKICALNFERSLDIMSQIRDLLIPLSSDAAMSLEVSQEGAEGDTGVSRPGVSAAIRRMPPASCDPDIIVNHLEDKIRFLPDLNGDFESIGTRDERPWIRARNETAAAFGSATSRLLQDRDESRDESRDEGRDEEQEYGNSMNDSLSGDMIIEDDFSQEPDTRQIVMEVALGVLDVNEADMTDDQIRRVMGDASIPVVTLGSGESGTQNLSGGTQELSVSTRRPLISVIESRSNERCPEQDSSSGSYSSTSSSDSSL